MAYKFNREQVLEMQQPDRQLTMDEAESLSVSYLEDCQSSSSWMSREWIAVKLAAYIIGKGCRNRMET